MKSIALLILGVVILGGASWAAVTWRTSDDPTESTDLNELARQVTTQEVIPPALTYDNAYNGPLFLTGEKTGDSAPVDLLINDMRRNGVNDFIAYFGVDGESPDDAEEDLTYAQTMIASYPGRVIPFFSPGVGGDEAEDMLGTELTDQYRLALTESTARFGEAFMRGIGEIETQEWNIPHDDARVRELIDIASENRLAVMLHPLPGHSRELANLLSSYPSTTFLIHLYQEDFAQERTTIIQLMNDYPNLFFTIDADHLLFHKQSGTGLLYAYEDESITEAVQAFVKTFDADSPAMLKRVIDLYRPLIAAHPTRVTIGTEMNLRYAYEPDVFDRTIRYVREFIAAMPTDAQEAIAFNNAHRLFGYGIMIE